MNLKDGDWDWTLGPPSAPSIQTEQSSVSCISSGTLFAYRKDEKLIQGLKTCFQNWVAHPLDAARPHGRDRIVRDGGADKIDQRFGQESAGIGHLRAGKVGRLPIFA